ncbi:hypothetical protein [Nitrosopumilus sp. S6]
MGQVSKLESTYAEIVDTEKELLEMISKKSINKDLEHAMATIAMVSK